AEGILSDALNEVFIPMQKAGIDIRDLDSYLFHRRVASERKEKINPEGWTAERSAAKMKELEQEHPILKDMAKVHDDLWKE
ncbi:MAG: hypothetical protein GWO38_08965, partial [Phycisphaerae bacterium]|nr:hypothetical protein [Phycisphaerae bacterium]NIX27749.1 hypothetical protein [Phycisphaerae bacterium]